MQFNNALIIICSFPILLNSQNRFQKIVTNITLIFHIELYIINRWNLKFRRNSFLRRSILIHHHQNLMRSLLLLITDRRFQIDHKNRLYFSLTACFVFYRIDILTVLKCYIVILLNERVKSVFDLIFRTTYKLSTNLRPFAANFTIQLQYFHIFLFSPIFFSYFRI